MEKAKSLITIFFILIGLSIFVVFILVVLPNDTIVWGVKIPTVWIVCTSPFILGWITFSIFFGRRVGWDASLRLSFFMLGLLGMCLVIGGFIFLLPDWAVGDKSGLNIPDKYEQTRLLRHEGYLVLTPKEVKVLPVTENPVAIKEEPVKKNERIVKKSAAKK